jgi:hypothetical protein
MRTIDMNISASHPKQSSQAPRRSTRNLVELRGKSSSRSRSVEDPKWPVLAPVSEACPKIQPIMFGKSAN